MPVSSADIANATANEAQRELRDLKLRVEALEITLRQVVGRLNGIVPDKSDDI